MRMRYHKKIRIRAPPQTSEVGQTRVGSTQEETMIDGFSRQKNINLTVDELYQIQREGVTVDDDNNHTP